MHFCAGGFAALHGTVDDVRFDSMQTRIIQESGVAASVAHAPRLGKDQRKFTVPVPDQTFRRHHPGVFRLGIHNVDTVAKQIVFQKNNRNIRRQNRRNLRRAETVDRKCKQDHIPVQCIQTPQIIRTGIRFKQRAGETPSRMSLHLRLDLRIQILPVLRRPVAMNTCHGADRLVPVPADVDSLCRFNGNLSFRLQARQRFLDRPP